MSGLGRAVRMNASRPLPEVDDAIRGRARSRAPMCARKPCKRQSPRQDRSFGHKLEDADRRWESKPRSPAPRQRLSPRPRSLSQLSRAAFQPGDRSPRRKSIGADARRGSDMWARKGRNANPPIRGNKPAKGRRIQERRRARNEGRRNHRPARPWMSGPRSGTPRRQRTRRCMMRTDGTKSKRRRSTWLDLRRA